MRALTQLSLCHCADLTTTILRARSSACCNSLSHYSSHTSLVFACLARISNMHAKKRRSSSRVCSQIQDPEHTPQDPSGEEFVSRILKKKKTFAFINTVLYGYIKTPTYPHSPTNPHTIVNNRQEMFMHLPAFPSLWNAVMQLPVILFMGEAWRTVFSRAASG